MDYCLVHKMLEPLFGMKFLISRIFFYHGKLKASKILCFILGTSGRCEGEKTKLALFLLSYDHVFWRSTKQVLEN